MSTRHLNQVQLADRWNISPRTLERWRWIGEGLTYLKIGGRVVYRLEDVERYEAEHLRGETTDRSSVSVADDKVAPAPASNEADGNR